MRRGVWGFVLAAVVVGAAGAGYAGGSVWIVNGRTQGAATVDLSRGTQTFETVRAESFWRLTVTETAGEAGVTTGLAFFVTNVVGEGRESACGFYRQCVTESIPAGLPTERALLTFTNAVADTGWLMAADFAAPGSLVYLWHGTLAFDPFVTPSATMSTGAPFTIYIDGDPEGDSAEVAFVAGYDIAIEVAPDARAEGVGVVGGRWQMTDLDVNGFPVFSAPAGGAVHIGGCEIDLTVGEVNYGWGFVSDETTGAKVEAQPVEGASTIMVYQASARMTTNSVGGASVTNWVELTGPTTNLWVLVAGGGTNTLAITNGWLHAVVGE